MAKTTDKQLSDGEVTFLPPGQAADLLHVTTKTLQRMAIRGEVKAITLPSGHRRYDRKSVEAIIAGHAA